MTSAILKADATALPLAAGSVDAIVTDPPYELGFMGKGWDSSGVAFQAETWGEALRVAKPGTHLLAFGGTRTHHRLMVAIEDAGWEIRDCLMWLYGSGFPKATDKTKVGRDGWNTALKPAWEPIVLARKPLIGTVAANVAAHGTGALNIDASRIGTEGGGGDGLGSHYDRLGNTKPLVKFGPDERGTIGRWPANLILDEEAAAMLDRDVGEVKVNKPGQLSVGPAFSGGFGPRAPFGYEDSGGPSRFFYTAKASRSEREAGLEGFTEERRSDGREKDIENPRLRTSSRRNDHPTVKPVSLMRYLCELVTPPGGLVLDPFVGSGSTGMGALDAGLRFVGVDLEPHYAALASARIQYRHSFAPAPSTAALPQGRIL